MTEEEKEKILETLSGQEVIFGSGDLFLVNYTANYKNNQVRIPQELCLDKCLAKAYGTYGLVAPHGESDILLESSYEYVERFIYKILSASSDAKIYFLLEYSRRFESVLLRSEVYIVLNNSIYQELLGDSCLLRYKDSEFDEYNLLKIQSDDEHKEPLEIKMGFEWEVPIVYTCNREKELLVIDFLKDAGLGEWFIVKHDGSLDDSDPEIVSSPLYLHQFKELVPKLKCLSSIIRPEDREDYGLHIHCDIKSLSNTHWHLARILLNNNKANWEIFGGRKENNWCNYSYSSSRYNALNLEPEHTVEFRLFKSPKDPMDIIKFLEAVQGFINEVSKIKIDVDEEKFMGEIKYEKQ